MSRQSKYHPESHMMSYGYNPQLSEGSIKPPIFQTSTFVFQSAEEGKAYFELAYGIREQDEQEELGLIYSRINNPNLEILEDRLCLWDGAEEAAVFESGMSAISTVLMEFLSPGDLLVYSAPVYGGTAHFIQHILPKYNIKAIAVHPHHTEADIANAIELSGRSHRLSMMYLETPANPTNHIIDISLWRSIADQLNSSTNQTIIAVDNTYMGPIWCHPLQHGADLVLYSATKYIGGHSDLIAGAVLGNREMMKRVKTLRTFLGNMASPHTCWLLLRSLETLKVRMDRQMQNAEKLATYLQSHPAVINISYLGLLTPESKLYELYKKQYSSPGAMISIEIKGGEREAFAFLNHLRLIKLAVSLGGTESLAQHPYSMTHAGIDPVEKIQLGITENLVRISVGVEHIDDLIDDIDNALSCIHQSSHARTLS